jgi:hypothetical protein
MPEPGPVGVKVDPLGEPLGASVFPDGFVAVLGALVPPGPANRRSRRIRHLISIHG